MKTTSSVTLVLSLLLVTSHSFPQRLESRLLPYTRCELSGGLAPTVMEHAAGLPMARPVETAAGQQRVSVADGYRMILAFPNTDPFVNLKVELSMPGRYAIDKQIVLAQMQHMSATARGIVVSLERSAIGEVDIAALNNPGIDGAALSFYTFFIDSEDVIATAYILNQAPDRRAFQSIAEFESLRDRFVREFGACLTEGH